jgi:hypothetical protein
MKGNEMKRDENGIAVPHEESPIPWTAADSDEWASVRTRAGDGNMETLVCEPYFRVDADFIAHAANYHHRLADLVRRLATEGIQGDISSLIVDASYLWAEMTDETKGGGE